MCRSPGRGAYYKDCEATLAVSQSGGTCASVLASGVMGSIKSRRAPGQVSAFHHFLEVGQLDHCRPPLKDRVQTTFP